MKRVEEAKAMMEEEMMQELARRKVQALEEAKQKEVSFRSCRNARELESFQ